MPDIHPNNRGMEKRIKHRQEVGQVECEAEPYHRLRGAGEDTRHQEWTRAAEDGRKVWFDRVAVDVLDTIDSIDSRRTR